MTIWTRYFRITQISFFNVELLNKNRLISIHCVRSILRSKIDFVVKEFHIFFDLYINFDNDEIKIIQNKKKFNIVKLYVNVLVRFLKMFYQYVISLKEKSN